MTQKRVLPVLLTAGVALTATSNMVNAETNPFVSQEIISGYQVAEAGSGFDAEGRCGEGKCGANASDKQTVGDGTAIEDAGDAFKKGTEGRCGEGKCGANASDKQNLGDGTAIEDAGDAFKKGTEGRCGEGKCGANATK